MSPVFGHGMLRLYLLKLLDESPRHGYEVIRLLEDRFLGLYAPSAGTVYPRLARLEAEGLVTHDEADGRKVYRLTDAGREELHRRQDELHDLEAEIRSSVHDFAQEIREEVRGSVRNLREELRQAARDIRRQERHVSRHQRNPDQQDHQQQRCEHPWSSHGAGKELEHLIDRFREQARAVIRTGTVTEEQVQACKSMLSDALAALQRALDRPDRAGDVGDRAGDRAGERTGERTEPKSE